MGFFSELKELGGSWKETSREKLSKEELKTISSIEVVERHSKEGEAFNCMVFFLKSGKQKSAYLSKMSDLEVGDSVDPKSVVFINLERDGETTTKADGEAL
jgi:hypothetical protein